jgi:hypothetical protein
LGALVLLAMVVLIGACGSSAHPGGSDSAANAQRAVKFAQCMRSHGVGQFPEPGASGSFTIDAVVNGSSMNPDAPAFKQAMSECRALEPAGFTGPKVTTPQQRAARLKFAQCIRVNGVPDFPDPTPNGPLVDTNRIPSSNSPGGMTALNAAMHKCGGIYSGELGLRRQ